MAIVKVLELVASHDTQVVKNLGYRCFCLFCYEPTLKDLFDEISLRLLCVSNVLTFSCFNFLSETLRELGFLLLALLSLVNAFWLRLNFHIGHFDFADDCGLASDCLNATVFGLLRGTIYTFLNFADSILGQSSNCFFYRCILGDNRFESY